ncbi:hypothetical protein ATO6_11420 [Oceanicola sp. 22II-s10i]|uniref:HlyD family efflux transporter periplasmic adaptor subunit n=1 Tax=Oceanicola sp. 22II-s10i TaxID=1317116 RepID=UPI000B528DFB|nr:HlyD family efflux transporter periplasmic adaptor subunit [Oceanicola sp. 22II-s10i]OWU84912.1 hypothetical protein ATO6_11420 [Oceanicola sp. 22II-s10i]
MMTAEQTDAGPDPARDGDEAAWSVFLDPSGPPAFVEAWFSLLCRDLGGISRAILLLETTEGSLAPAARHPRGPAPPAPEDEETALKSAVAEARENRTAAVRSAGGDRRVVALPVAPAGRAEAVVALVVPSAMLSRTVRRAQWGMGWLHSLIAERAARRDATTGAGLADALAVLAALEDGASLEAALRALVNELQPLIRADRVGVALLRRGRLRLRALSQTAEVEHRTDTARGLVQAMEEARLQLRTVTWPDNGDTIAVTAAHAAHAARAGSLALVTVPLFVRGELIAVLAAERLTPRDGDAAFTEAERARLEDIADLTAPHIGLRLREHRMVSGRLRVWTARAMRMLFGARHQGVKAIALMLAALVAWLSLAQTDLRVTATGRVQGAVSRVATAPFDSYIATAPVRAGDTVAQGEVLATLDDRDLRLDLLKWESERAKLIQERNAAQAEGDRAALSQLAARIARVEAEADLARSRLERIEIRAPMAGLVTEGDLSQQLGAPVSRGDALFRIASGESFRLEIEVGEYDIGLVQPGAAGTLALTGLSARQLGFEVRRLAQVAETGDGRTFFRVEAALTDPPADLRPGLQGIAKIEAGDSSLLYAIVRPLVDRTRILLWKLRP